MAKNKKYSYDYNYYVMKPLIGTSIGEAARSALVEALLSNKLVKIIFNDCILNVTPYMKIEEIIENYNRKLDNDIYKYQNSAEGMKKKLMEKLAGIKKTKETEKVLKSISDEKFETQYKLFWEDSKKKNSDAYGKAIFDFAETWAKLMQKEIKDGKPLTKEVVEQKKEVADFSGLTGYAYRAATYKLIACWKYAPELAKALAIHGAIVQDFRDGAERRNNELKNKVQQAKTR